MSLQIKGTLVFLSARKYDFVNKQGKEVRGVSLSLYDNSDSSSIDSIGGDVMSFTAPIDNWGIYKNIEPLSQVSVNLTQVNGKMKLLKLDPLNDENITFGEDIEL